MTILVPKDFGFDTDDVVFIQHVCDDNDETFEEFAKHAIINAAIETDGRVKL